jgi:hypothetical protein
MLRSAEDPAGTHVAERVRRRDVALRRTRGLVASVAAAAVGLSGLASVVAAQAFKGHHRRALPPAPVRRARTPHVHVPAPDRIPPIAGDPAPLQPPAQPPAPAPAAPTPSAPAPQVSGGS